LRRPSPLPLPLGRGEGRVEKTLPLAFNGLCTPFGSPVIGGQKPSRAGRRKR